MRIPHRNNRAGFSLIEIIIVIALIAFVYTVALPEFSQRTGAEVANKLNQLALDIRSAYDEAVLRRKPFRIVFMLATGDYWLEEADRDEFFLGNDRLDRDPTVAEEKDEQVAFEGKLQEFVDLAGTVVIDQDGEREIPPTSPVVQARDRLRKPEWTRVQNMEWSVRALGPNLLIKDMQAEHHGDKQDFGDLGREARAMLYFFPNGYVERAVIHIAYAKDEMVPDESQEPYTVITNPYEGNADILNGYLEIDVRQDEDN